MGNALGGATERQRRGRRGRHLPVVLSAVAAVVVASGALMTTTTALRSADEAQSQAAPATAPQHITGSKVFRPDLIRASLNERADPDAGRPVPDGKPQDEPALPGRPDAPEQPAQPAPEQPQAPQQPADGGDEAPQTQAPPSLPASPATPPPPVAPTTTTNSGGSGGTGGSGGSGGGSGGSGGLLCGLLPVTDPLLCPLLAPVQSFYANAPTEPAQAFSLLDTPLQGGESVDQFAQSWDGVTSATVDEAELAGQDTVQVQVTYEREDGSKVVTVQRLVVRGAAGDGKAKIVEAELLSAVHA